jgi:ketosteroid isomerase-like protein
VGTVTDQGETRVSKFFNSATFLKRKGKWQVVNYQVTRIPQSEEESKKEVAAAEAAYWKAVLAGDAKAVERLTDPGFIWVHHTGEQNDRKKMLDDITSGALKYAKLETEKITVTVAGDTAIVRGTSTRQRVNQNPFTTFYTLVFVNRGGAWKAISLHTSRAV